MARKKRTTKKRTLSRQEQIVEDLKLRASTGRFDAPRWSITVEHLEKKDTSVHFALFAARAFFDMLVADDDWDFVDDESNPSRGIIETSGGLTITGSRKSLEAVTSYKMKPRELEYWHVPENYLDRITFVRSDFIPPPEETTTRRKRHSRKGMIKIDAVAEQMNLEPKKLRSMLRRSNIEKPEHGWAWQHQRDVDLVIQQLTGETPKIKVNFRDVKEPE